VGSAAELVAAIAAAGDKRRVCATRMNDASSRSHMIVSVRVVTTDAQTQTAATGKLTFVDLAGSERLKKSGSTGDAQREAAAINKSLSALGDVVAALASGAAHVPYRNSKLTHLLAPCLGGTGKTLMVVNVAPDAASAKETLCSLRFAATVNQVETKAKGGAKRAVTATTGASGAPAAAAAARKRAAPAPARR
jgi:hypothetical protein